MTDTTAPNPLAGIALVSGSLAGGFNVVVNDKPIKLKDFSYNGVLAWAKETSTPFVFLTFPRADRRLLQKRGITVKLLTVYNVVPPPRAVETVANFNLPGDEEGQQCLRNGCTGVLELYRKGDCSCHINPPCGACMEALLVCPACGWEKGDAE